MSPTITPPTWRRGKKVAGAAWAMIALSVVCQVVALRATWYSVDDFRFVALATEGPPGWSYLTQPVYGQLMPGGLFLTWILTWAAGYNWVLTWSVVLLMQVGAYVYVLRTLRLLFGDRPAILVPLAFYLFSPLTVPAVAWYSAAMLSVTLQLAVAGALYAHVRHLREGTLKSGLRTVAWTAFGLLFFIKAAVIPLLLVVVTLFAAPLVVPGVRGLRDALRLLLRQRILLVLHGLLLAGYGACYLVTGATASSYVPVGVERGIGLLPYIGRVIGETFLTGAVGGPAGWQPGAGHFANAAPPALLLGFAWLVWALAVVASLIFRRGAWRAWLVLLTWLLVADALFTWLGRATAWSGWELRYVADAAPVLAVCLALAFLPVRDLPGNGNRTYLIKPPSGPAVKATAGVLAGAMAALSILSASSFGKLIDTTEQRAYIGNAARALAAAPAGTAIYPTDVPMEMPIPATGLTDLTSRVLAPVAPRWAVDSMRAPEPATEPRVFDDKGDLVKMTIKGGGLLGPPAGLPCFPTIGGVVDLPLSTDGGPLTVAGLGYAAFVDTTASATVDGRRLTLPLKRGDGVVYFPVRSAVRSLSLTVSGGTCVKAIAVGEPAPVEPS
ncbi:hypothetical protein Psi02_74470 [Planotetraspora silvatica]|uniref:Uncharacterized protein n=1 Tax=Planotetraspora silvatica TaxID=234614 RepID=A0A8J3UTJ6_9ACTN|nr:hypothetical protein [Planotetraspora silvatica]GII51023.1 hypothetical protein Psi02_74470 [Planotetraspora silvatica]